MIREATEADLPTITEITNEAVANTTASWNWAPTTLAARTAWFADRRAAGFPVLVAEAGGAVVGFASYGPFRPFDGYRHTVEHSIYVHPSGQGRGAGRALLAALVAHAEAAGLMTMVAGIDASNERSVRLHEAAGFTRAGELRAAGRKFGRWLDLLFMQRMLSPGPADPA